MSAVFSELRKERKKRSRRLKKFCACAAFAAVVAGAVSVILSGCSGPPLKWIVQATPTVFFITENEALFQLAEVIIAYWIVDPPSFKGLVEVRDTATGETVSTVIEKITVGEKAYRVKVPDVDVATVVSFRLLDISDPERPVFQNEISVEWAPERKWEISLIPSSHIDLYSTANADITPEQHRRIIDTACELCEEHPEYTFQLENKIPIYEYLDGHRPHDQVERFISLLKAGRIDFGAQLTGVHQHATSGESYIQGQLLPWSGGADLEREYGIRPQFLAVYDTPGVMKQVPEFLSKSGVRYMVYAPNASYRIQEMTSIPYIFYWESESGARVLCWRSSFGYNAEKDDYFRLTDPDPTARESALNEKLMRRKNSVDDRGLPNLSLHYPFDRYAILWDYGDNEPADSGPLQFAREWNRCYAYPRFKVSSYAEFLGEMEALYGDSIPTVRGELPNCWEFVLMNQGVINLYDRYAQRVLPLAQTMAAISSIFGAAETNVLEKVRMAYLNMAKIEAHDFFYGARFDDETGQLVPDYMNPDWAKAEWALLAERLSRESLSESTESFASLVNSPRSERIVVFNGLSSPRSGPVWLKLPNGLQEGRFCLKDDKSGEIVVHQVVDAQIYEDLVGKRPLMKNQNEHFKGAYPDPPTPSGKYLVFTAKDVPPVGYRTYKIVRGREPSRGAGERHSWNPFRDERCEIENEYYKVTMDPSSFSVRQILDKETGQVLVDESASAGNRKILFNQFLKGYPSLDSANILINLAFLSRNRSFWQPILDAITRSSVRFWEPERLEGVLEVIASGPVVSSIRANLRDSRGSQRKQTVVLYQGLKRVDFINWVKSTGCVPFERQVLSFPLNFRGAFSVKYKNPHSLVSVGEDELPGGPSPHRHSGEWVLFEGDGRKVCISTPDLGPFTLGRPDLNLVDDARYTKPDKPHYFPILLDTCSWSAFVVPGSYTARFSLSSSAEDSANRLIKDQEGFSIPLAGSYVYGSSGPFKPGAKSFFSVSEANVDIALVKKCERGSGLVIRLVETRGRSCRFRLRVCRELRIVRAFLTGFDESETSPLRHSGSSVSLSARPFEIITARLELEKRYREPSW